MPDSGNRRTSGLRVLIAEATSESRAQLERSLRNAGIDTVGVSGVRKAIAALIEGPFDTVVMSLSDSDTEALVVWVASHKPSVHLVAVLDADSPMRAQVADASNLTFIETAEAEAVLQQVHVLGPRRGFFGSAVEIELFDYVQLIALTGRDKVIEVETPAGKGTVWFEHGDIVHVEFGDFTGELGFYKLLAESRGFFSEGYWRAPSTRTVTRSSTHLLMEAARQSDEGILGLDSAVPVEERLVDVDDDDGPDSDPNDPETSFADLSLESSPIRIEPDVPANQASSAAAEGSERGRYPTVAPPVQAKSPLRPMASDNEDEDFAALVEDSLSEQFEEFERQGGDASNPFQFHGSSESRTAPSDAGHEVAVPTMELKNADSLPAEAALSTTAGHAVLDDPATRSVMLEQFWQFEGINGVAIISSTGKVLAEDMRDNSSLVTLAGFYMRGAARIARALGHNVFDGVVARSMSGYRMVMVSMGAASAVLSVDPSADPEAVRDAVMGVE